MDKEQIKKLKQEIVKLEALIIQLDNNLSARLELLRNHMKIIGERVTKLENEFTGLTPPPINYTGDPNDDTW